MEAWLSRHGCCCGRCRQEASERQCDRCTYVAQCGPNECNTRRSVQINETLANLSSNAAVARWDCALLGPALRASACKTLASSDIYIRGRRAGELIPSRRHIVRREERLGMPGGFVEGTTRRVVVLVEPLGGRPRVLRVVVVDRRRRPAAPRRPRGGPRRARFVTGSHVDEGRAGRGPPARRPRDGGATAQRRDRVLVAEERRRRRPAAPARTNIEWHELESWPSAFNDPTAL